ncbi:MAG: hypothetical protein IJY22_03975 [Clostridia bacterium]|nr:hypothetical protein [Clostridia bacterium]
MITVTPIQEKSKQEALCALCGIPFRIDLLAYEARNEKGEFAGICQFHMDPEGGHIYDLVTPDQNDPDDALFVMGRAALNFIDLCGIKIAYFDGKNAEDALLRRIGFSTDKNGRYTVSLEGFFSHPCQHC